MKRNFHIMMLMALCLPHCMGEPEGLVSRPPKEGSKQSTLKQDKTLEPKTLWNPAQAKVSFLSPQHKEPEVLPLTQYGSLKVPTLDLKFTQADYVKVLRCHISFNPSLLYDKKDMFQEALGQHKYCRLVGAEIYRQKISDAAAKDGSFYYLIAPCVSALRSTTKANGCSAHVIQSDPIHNFRNDVSDEFITLSERLNAAEGELAAKINFLSDLSTKISRKREACEIKLTQKEEAEKFFIGVGQIAAMTGVTIAMSIATGPALGIALGQTVGWGIQLVFRAGFGQRIECPDVQKLVVAGSAAAERTSTLLSEINAIRQQMSRIEAAYNNFDQTIREENTGQKKAPSN